LLLPDPSFLSALKTIDYNAYFLLIVVLKIKSDKGEILADDNIYFYKNQILFLRQQLEENKQYNQLFLKQIEMKDQEAEEGKDRIKELEEKLYQQELEKLELKHQLELEKNKSIWQRILGRSK
ncbi:MAG TPA: hypothetical protein GX530_09605, partial [Corynebacteriales bacterium]|nr:hypothetical protein [Mycobacteriales bacterium]